MGVRVRYKSLAALDSFSIRYSWRIIKDLNLAASKCLQFVNMSEESAENKEIPSSIDCLGMKLKYFRSLIMGVIKLELCQKIMVRTSVSRDQDETPKIELERLKGSR